MKMSAVQRFAIFLATMSIYYFAEHCFAKSMSSLTVQRKNHANQTDINIENITLSHMEPRSSELRTRKDSLYVPHQRKSTTPAYSAFTGAKAQNHYTGTPISDTQSVSSASGNAGPSSWTGHITVELIQKIFTPIGVFLNAISIIVFGTSKIGYSKVILILLRHQSLMDLFVCAIAFIVLVQPASLHTGYYGLDFVICHFWQSQALYWGAIFLSIYNLVLIAVDRYLAVCKPFKYITISSKQVYAVLVLMYFVTCIMNAPSYFEAGMKNNTCVSEIAIAGKVGEDFFFAYGIISYFTVFVVPASILISLYLGIYCTLRKSSLTMKRHGGSFDKLSAQLTRTALIITVIFVLFIGTESTLYLLGYATQLVEYSMNSPIEKIGVFLTQMNSFINPFIYFSSMPNFRNSLTILCRCSRNTNKNTRKESTSNLSGMKTDSTVQTGAEEEKNENTV